MNRKVETGLVYCVWPVPCCTVLKLLWTRVKQDSVETRVDEKDCSYFDPLCMLKLAEQCQLLGLKVVDEQG